MAGTWQRVKTVFQAKTNKALDRVEDPRETLDLSYEQQLEQLTKIRRSVADVATARKRIELQAASLKEQAEKLQTQAKAALEQGNEPLAREALSRRATLATQLADLEAQHNSIGEQETKLIDTMHLLETQIEAFRTKKETLKATYTAAEAQTKVGEAVTGISTSMGDAGLAMQRAEDKIATMQARAGAIDDLIASGALTDLSTPTDDIQRQLDLATTTSSVDAELAALKAQLGTTTPPAIEAEEAKE
jgi:phage shock protein A